MRRRQATPEPGRVLREKGILPEPTDQACSTPSSGLLGDHRCGGEVPKVTRRSAPFPPAQAVTGRASCVVDARPVSRYRPPQQPMPRRHSSALTNHGSPPLVAGGLVVVTDTVPPPPDCGVAHPFGAVVMHHAFVCDAGDTTCAGARVGGGCVTVAAPDDWGVAAWVADVGRSGEGAVGTVDAERAAVAGGVDEEDIGPTPVGSADAFRPVAAVRPATAVVVPRARRSSAPTADRPKMPASDDADRYAPDRAPQGM